MINKVYVVFSSELFPFTTVWNKAWSESCGAFESGVAGKRDCSAAGSRKSGETHFHLTRWIFQKHGRFFPRCINCSFSLGKQEAQGRRNRSRRLRNKAIVGR